MGFIDRLANAWHIFTTSLAFIAKDKSLLVVPVILVLSVLVLCFGFFAMFFVPALGGAFIFNIVIFLFVVYAWTTFLGAAQAWMVHEVAQGKDATVLSGFGRAVRNIGDILIFAAVMLVIGAIAGRLRQKGGLGHWAGGLLETVAGIAGKLVLPAMIVTERNFIEAVRQLRHALKVIPEIATYEIGIRPLTSLVLWLGIGLSVLLFFSAGFIAGITLLVLWLLAVIVISIQVNQIYYTLLYLTLIEKKHIKGLRLHRLHSKMIE